MSLYDDLVARREIARKNHDSATLDAVQNIISAIKNEQINGGKSLSDLEVQTIIARQVKQLKDARADFAAAGRNDLTEKTDIETKLLESFLPDQIGDEELNAIARAVIAELGTVSIRDLGQVMGAVMARVKGRADGSRVRAMVSEIISGG